MFTEAEQAPCLRSFEITSTTRPPLQKSKRVHTFSFLEMAKSFFGVWRPALESNDQTSLAKKFSDAWRLAKNTIIREVLRHLGGHGEEKNEILPQPSRQFCLTRLA